MGYKIERVLNTNAIVTLDDNNNEIVITGSGIAFGKKYGGYVPTSKVDKIYRLENKNSHDRFIQLIQNIPNEYFEITDKIINYCQNEYNITVNESIYITLTDHIYNAVQRYNNGIIFSNNLLWETKQLYLQEFKVGLYALTLIEKITSVMLPEDEAAFIALHIVNSEAEYLTTNVSNMTKLVKDLLHIIEFHFQKEIDKESIDYHRLVSHIKFFINRILNHLDINVKGNNILLNNLILTYPHSYQCLTKIDNFLRIKENYILNDTEKLYLLIHISKLYE